MRANASAKTYRIGLIASIALLAVAIFAGQAIAEEPVSILTASSGEISIDRHSPPPEADRPFPPRVGMRQVLYVGDVVKTGPGAKAKLLVGDDSLIVLSEETELKIEQFVDPPDADSGRSASGGKVRVTKGFARVAFQPLEDSGSAASFTVETPAATITAEGSCEALVMVSDDPAKKVTFWSIENTWEVESADQAAGVVRIPQGYSTEVLAGELPGRPEPVSQPKLAEFRDSMTMRETALTRPTPSIDRGDFIYHDYTTRGWMFASRPKRYKTAAAASSKKPSYASNGGMNGHSSHTEAPLGPIGGSVSLVSAVPQGVMSALHKGFTSVFSENGK